MRIRARGWLLAGALALALPGCTAISAHPAPTSACEPAAGTDDAALYQAASAERSAWYEREVARLHADLAQAEQQMIAIESGLRSAHTRADAVSSIADARIALARAERRAPWRSREAAEGSEKLAEAERQLEAGHTGSAVFFASRALRIASNLDEEGRQVEQRADTRFVRAARVNLRAGPSTEHPVVDVLEASTPVFPERDAGAWLLVRTVTGPVGWIHASLLDPR